LVEADLSSRWDFNRMSDSNRHAAWNLPGRWPRLAGRALVKAYRYTLSPLIGFHCRYLPTCSDYADQALERHGLWAGGWITAARLCRCHPWGNSGLDFVCETLPNSARWYMPWRYGRWRGTDSETRS
jgi:putative membrane protein insertion efficiency factor